MNWTDIISLAWRNLRQARLRTSLTALGVVIGVGAIITMVSFGVGLQENILNKAFARLDLFTVISVFGPSTDELLALSGGGGPGTRRDAPETPPANANDNANDNDSQPDLRRRLLDDAAIEEMARLPGVRYALPVIIFQSIIRYGERTERGRIGGAAAATDFNPRFKKFLAGGGFSSDEAREAIVSENFLDRARRRAEPGRPARRGGGPFAQVPDKTDAERAAAASAAIGSEVILLTLAGNDGAGASVFGIPLPGAEPVEGDEGRFERHVFKIVGVLPSEGGLNIDQLSRAEIYVPILTARRFREANRDPLERLGEALIGDTGYARAEVRVSDPTHVREVQRQLTRLGFNSFSLSNQIDEIRYVFLVVNGALALLGGLALLVASFGIANTMIMSILERTREIGIMKAIGGTDGEIMGIFFTEASLIGLAGGALGVIAGWGVDRVANYLVNRFVVKQPTPIEFFSIPWYLWGGAIIFAVAISLLAALYPALRAARVDPVRALRHD
jgi:putative ABC transport system permease protein